jgi:hypothetical protein
MEFHKRFPIQAVTYCNNTWLVLFKEKLVACYINRNLHFGVTVTSPIEGCHAGIKAFLKRSTQDLMGVYERLLDFWESQNRRIINTIAGKKYRVLHSTNKAPFIPLCGLVHEYALLLLVQELTRIPLKGPLPTPCTCTIQASHGLPCFHILKERTQDPGHLLADDIHPHWWIERPKPGTSTRITMPVPHQLLDPMIVRGKGRPKGAVGKAKGIAPVPVSSGVSSKYLLSRFVLENNSN